MVLCRINMWLRLFSIYLLLTVIELTKRVTVWSCNSTSGSIFGENSNLKTYMHPNVHSGTFYNSQDMEAAYVSIDGMDKED